MHRKQGGRGDGGTGGGVAGVLACWYSTTANRQQPTANS
ncbi:hypothetical protein PL8927_740001 [Planktothrix serta PCC 8927]|uniref:Uncharacterized protein n=1 Tax=Planktothrix serta PCC 8927 TaxID=671068 RepID=A0A7Z9E442_9CYAN|nr:hypothetical protein PL8927_740001 [Planktothrix serta PCC 8927]